MLQSRSRANFTQKALATERRTQIRVQNLDGYIAIMTVGVLSAELPPSTTIARCLRGGWTQPRPAPD